MSTEPVRASADWLTLREPADAAARSRALVRTLRSSLKVEGTIEVHDLGCGTGSMTRWLAEQLNGPQCWVLYDRDAVLLARAAKCAPAGALDSVSVSVETRQRDITRLDPSELRGADLITASALLDMLTAEDLGRLVSTCAGAGCPVLFTLSVIGRVDLSPVHPLDRSVMEAFNGHQRRVTGSGRLLGPDAARAAVDGFSRLGLDVVVRPSPWRLGAGLPELTVEWFAGWLAAACEQRPELRADAERYARRRLAQAASGELSVTVHHEDLLARPTT